MRKRKVLVVDDEVKIQTLIQDILSDQYQVILAGNGEQALEMARENQPDLILLDVLMPKMNGTVACEFLRKGSATKNIPVIMLTALKDRADRVNAFESGADDYLSKPFHPDELIARIESKIKRFDLLVKSQPAATLKRGNLKMDLIDRQVLIDDEPIYFTLIEFNILRILLEAQGEICPRQVLIQSIWKNEVVPARILDSHVLTVRRKLKKFTIPIETVYGTGYLIRNSA